MGARLTRRCEHAQSFGSPTIFKFQERVLTRPLLASRSEAGSPSPRRNRRGDIHSGAPPTPSGLGRAARPARSDGGLPTSSAASRQGRGAGGPGGEPSSSAAGAQNDDEDDEDENAPVTVVWGTTVTLQSTMKSFQYFLDEFRAGDRQAYDSRRYDAAIDAGDIELAQSIESAHVKERPEKKMYQHYLERMRETGQTNVNLDVLDLRAFREGQNTRKQDIEYHQLYRNLLMYPQEIIPLLDQKLKDCACDWAWNNLGGALSRADNTLTAERMMAATFKVRPFGGERKVNMRELNPQGASYRSLGRAQG